MSNSLKETRVNIPDESKYNTSRPLNDYDYDSSLSGYSDRSVPVNDIPETREVHRNEEHNTPTTDPMNFDPRCEYAPIYVVSKDVELGGREITDDDVRIIYFKLSVAQSSKAFRLAFIRKVYGILSTQIFITACIGAIFMFTPGIKEYLREHIWLIIVSVVGSLIFLMPLYCLRKQTPTNFILLITFTICQATSIGIVIAFYPKLIVLKAFILTMLAILGLSIYACQSTYDFSPWYSGLFAGLLILTGLGVSQIYLYSAASELFIGFIGAMVFCVFILVDSQLIMKRLSPEEYILAAITLYMDAVQLFLYILRILSIIARFAKS